jgi:1-acyl-sn-glycerol-3-phosphate acyltransferase
VAKPDPEQAAPPPRSPHFHPHPEGRTAIKLLKVVDTLFSRVYHKLIVLSPSQLPKRGPAILICNHTSGLDPLLIQSVCKRVIVWMMAEEYYTIPLLRPIFGVLEAIPVDRAARDSGAMRSALRALHDGRILGVFPEGRIEPRRELLPFQHGVVQMAAKTSAPVYPAFLDGTQHGTIEMGPAFTQRQLATIRFGQPLRFDRSAAANRHNLDAASEQMRRAVAALSHGGRWEKEWLAAATGNAPAAVAEIQKALP